MTKRILRTASLSLAVLLTAVSMSFAQAPATAMSPADAATTATSDAKKPTTSGPATSSTSITSTTAVQPSAEDMQKMMAQMMELSKTGENHKLLGEMAGSWSYTVKMWMDPTGKPQESKGTATRKAVMDGRFFIAEHSGKFQMPGADGKMKDMDFKGMAIEGYDNVKQKFVVAWIDSMGTMILLSQGAYDAATKTFTYTAECEMMPGKVTKIREVIKVVDKNHHTFEWYDDSHGPEAKTMEISYTRKK